jgi:hypothetical protein
MSRWDSQVGSLGGMYYNQSSTPVTVESVSLLLPHNLILHGAIVYEMAHYAHSLPFQSSWDREGSGQPAALWAARQRIPGAVIPPGIGPLALDDFSKKNPDVYEIAVDISAASPAGGWTPGVVVKYRARGRAYTATLMIGLAIASTSTSTSNDCNAETHAIQGSWPDPDRIPTELGE